MVGTPTHTSHLRHPAPECVHPPTHRAHALAHKHVRRQWWFVFCVDLGPCTMRFVMEYDPEFPGYDGEPWGACCEPCPSPNPTPSPSPTTSTSGSSDIGSILANLRAAGILGVPQQSPTPSEHSQLHQASTPAGVGDILSRLCHAGVLTARPREEPHGPQHGPMRRAPRPMRRLQPPYAVASGRGRQ